MKIDRIATLAASGLTPAAISTIVGLTPARISQIQATQEYEELLHAKTVELAEKDQEELSLSAKYLEAEHLLVKQVIEMAPISELRDVVGALRVVAERQEKAKARMNPILHTQPVFNNIVQLQLPTHAIPELVYGQNKEVLAIESRALTPLSSTGVLGLFKSMAAETTSNSAASQVSQAEATAAIEFRAEGEQHEHTRVIGTSEESPTEAISTDSNNLGPLNFFLPKQRMAPLDTHLSS